MAAFPVPHHLRLALRLPAAAGLALSEPLGVRHMAALALTLGGIALASRG
jgi:hypothetical protein